jgi:DNA-nicking Smr family endonuclease
MQSNIDHSAIINKGKSIALAIQVDDFLKAQGKSEPTQIPFGQTRMSMKPKDTEYKTGQQSMRESMADSVSKKRPVLSSTDRPLTKEQERHKFNFEAKTTALAKGESTFEGKCDLHGLTEFKAYQSGKHHCVKCRQRTSQLRKELSA